MGTIGNISHPPNFNSTQGSLVSQNSSNTSVSNSARSRMGNRSIQSSIEKTCEVTSNINLSDAQTSAVTNDSYTATPLESQTKSRGPIKFIDHSELLARFNDSNFLDRIYKNAYALCEQADGTYKAVRISANSANDPNLLMIREDKEEITSGNKNEIEKYLKYIESGGSVEFYDENHNIITLDLLPITIVVAPDNFNQLLLQKIQDQIIHKDKSNNDLEKNENKDKKKTSLEYQYEKNKNLRPIDVDQNREKQRDYNEKMSLESFFYTEKLFLEKMLDKISQIKKMKVRSEVQKDENFQNEKIEQKQNEIKNKKT